MCPVVFEGSGERGTAHRAKQSTVLCCVQLKEWAPASGGARQMQDWSAQYIIVVQDALS